ncbi:XdhC family protein [Roseateles sp. SL47]|uniref:XdhC family protein n=1 Tax=Roseateles sp. SL47 TaxID=2995138 RepID=UPI002271E064|nr:XdhC family protein [Roseateles sp. SL47]WAC73892.1 XdhC family protein [Roseateles sp. SL47]
MDNMDLQVLRQVQQWLETDQRVVLGTITRTWGSAPRPVGAVVAVRQDGVIAGSVSGGCIEDDLIDRIREGALRLERPELVRYGVGAEAAQRFGLPCGGTLELMLEPLGPQSAIPVLLERLGRGERVVRRLDLSTGEVRLLSPTEHGGDGADRLVLNEQELITHHGPQWRLLIIGAGQLSDYLARMALALDYQVKVCDPRDDYPWELAGVPLTRDMPDDVVQALKPDGHTAVVALTHDPKLDDLALMEALRSPAFYVGAIGSRVNQAKRRARLKEHFDLDDAALARLHGPVGLHIGARTPPEIALSILAHMTAERYGVQVSAVSTTAAGEQLGCTI